VLKVILNTLHHICTSLAVFKQRLETLASFLVPIRTSLYDLLYIICYYHCVLPGDAMR